jgi:hypothetical protein
MSNDDPESTRTSTEPTRPNRDGVLDPITELGTWSALLGHWVALVKAGEGLVQAAPDDPEAARWRASIPEVVTLQAITFALGDLAGLPEADRPLARDRADLGVTAAAATLDEIWHGVEMPESMLEIAGDARRAVDQAVYAGLRWIVLGGSSRMRMPVIDWDADPDADRGTLAVMLPGTIVLPGEPVAWWTERSRPPALIEELWEDVEGPPVQVYRELSEDGRVLGDLVASLDDLPAGLPLLAPIVLDGHPIGRPSVDVDAWSAANDRAFAEAPMEVPVRWTVERG